MMNSPIRALFATLLALAIGSSMAFTPAILPLKTTAAASRSLVAERTVLFGSSATLLEAPPTIEKSSTFKQDEAAKNANANMNNDDWWHLQLFDDDINYEYYVAATLVKIAGLTELQAYRSMKTATSQGSVMIGQYPLEQAEWYLDALTTEGLVVKILPKED